MAGNILKLEFGPILVVLAFLFQDPSLMVKLWQPFLLFVVLANIQDG